MHREGGRRGAEQGARGACSLTFVYSLELVLPVPRLGHASEAGVSTVLVDTADYLMISWGGQAVFKTTAFTAAGSRPWIGALEAK